MVMQIDVYTQADVPAWDGPGCTRVGWSRRSREARAGIHANCWSDKSMQAGSDGHMGPIEIRT